MARASSSAAPLAGCRCSVERPLLRQLLLPLLTRAGGRSSRTRADVWRNFEVPGRALKLATLGKNGFFGEQSLMQERGTVNPQGGIANATVQTISYCDLLILSGEDFDEVLYEHLKDNPVTVDHSHDASTIAREQSHDVQAAKKASLTKLRSAGQLAKACTRLRSSASPSSAPSISAAPTAGEASHERTVARKEMTRGRVRVRTSMHAAVNGAGVLDLPSVESSCHRHKARCSKE